MAHGRIDEFPILYALTESHADQASFRESLRSANDPDALTVTQTKLIRSGAVSDCIDKVLRRYRQLRQLLATLSLNNRDRLEPLLESAIITVEALLATIDITQLETAIGQ